VTLTAPRAALLAAGSLAVVYIATLAPSVTFWDAGEFIAAAHALGIPHPPGTPLFVILLNAWARVLGFLPFAIATNLFSSVCTAGAAGLTALWMARATREPLAGLAAGIAAGAMSTVWQNATETEVYAASLLLSIAAIVSAEQAGRTGERRFTLLSAYLIALTVPLHLSALVAAPVVVLLAATRPTGEFDRRTALVLAGVSVTTAGVGRMLAWVAGAGVAMIVGGQVDGWTSGRAKDRRDGAAGVNFGFAAIAIVAIALTATLFLIVRARFDPPINQANPRTWSQLAYVVARRQYDVAGLWPRRAPIWLQLANWFEYADWQWALRLDPGVVPNVWRILATSLFAGLGVAGAAWHRRLDRRSWRAVALLFACGSIGVIAYLNLRAGRTFAWSFVPDDAAHEARDRDYFFTLGFWSWGIWAGMGAVALARRTGRAWLAAAAALPIVLNWAVVNRRIEPEASLARETARQLLGPLPRNAVLFVEGDNDTYPLWYAQQVESERQDVTVVTLPLLGAPWYLDELQRRYGLGKGSTASDPDAAAVRIAADARAANRPIAAANTLEPNERRALSTRWRVVGLVAIAEAGAGTMTDGSVEISLDTVAIRRVARSIEEWRKDRAAHDEPDSIHEYFLRLFSCPARLLAGSGAPPSISLDSLCNLR
jgi:hypothetical protein